MAKRNSSKRPVVITTIQHPTDAIRGFAALPDTYCLAIGDRKTPAGGFECQAGVEFLSIEGQESLPFELLEYVPFDHYCRKNLGYLAAIGAGAKVLGESDDDNIPYEGWWSALELNKTREVDVVTGPPAVNVYSLFTDRLVWPRGLPLTAIHTRPKIVSGDGLGRVLVWQGLADQSPDVDAIFRLIFPEGEGFDFERDREGVVLDSGVFCPFNSQNTIWDAAAFPYLYLPMFVSFRFTDILRSYVAQRGIWAMDGHVAFMRASVRQLRNPHDLSKDLMDEIPMYRHVPAVIDALAQCDLSGDPYSDIVTMYQVLAARGVVEGREVEAVNAWVADLQRIAAAGHSSSGDPVQ